MRKAFPCPPSSLGARLLTPRLMLIRGASGWTLSMPYNAQDCRTTLRISRSCCRLRCPIAVVPGYATANRRSCPSPIGFGTLIYRLLAHRPVSFEHCGLASYFLVSRLNRSTVSRWPVRSRCALRSDIFKIIRNGFLPSTKAILRCVIQEPAA